MGEKLHPSTLKLVRINLSESGIYKPVITEVFSQESLKYDTKLKLVDLTSHSQSAEW